MRFFRTRFRSTEVRGIFAPKDDHPEIKDAARKAATKLQRKRAKEK